jgi:SAM-dependent methyltransferase
MHQNAGACDYEQMWSGAWGDLQKYGPQHRHKYRLILGLLGSIDFRTVLDVGCGSGTLLEAVSSRFSGLTLSGVDVSENALEAAAMRMPGDFQVLDLGREYLKSSFDLVLCCDVLEHIEDDRRAIMHLRKMTRRYLLVSVPRGQMRPSERMIGHFRNYRTTDLLAKLREAGFKPVKRVEWGFPFYSPLYRTIQEFTTPRVGEGKWGPGRRVIAGFLYWLYWLNLNRFGDILIVLAECGDA